MRPFAFAETLAPLQKKGSGERFHAGLKVHFAERWIRSNAVEV